MTWTLHESGGGSGFEGEARSCTSRHYMDMDIANMGVYMEHDIPQRRRVCCAFSPSSRGADDDVPQCHAHTLHTTHSAKAI